MKEYANEWKDIPYAWSRRLNIITIYLEPKVMHRFGAMFLNITIAVFSEIEKLILKFI
jgi:hypothetical protein